MYNETFIFNNPPCHAISLSQMPSCNPSHSNPSAKSQTKFNSLWFGRSSHDRKITIHSVVRFTAQQPQRKVDKGALLFSSYKPQSATKMSANNSKESIKLQIRDLCWAEERYLHQKNWSRPLVQAANSFLYWVVGGGAGWWGGEEE